jgi:hypothetical protein
MEDNQKNMAEKTKICADAGGEYANNFYHAYGRCGHSVYERNILYIFIFPEM